MNDSPSLPPSSRRFRATVSGFRTHVSSLKRGGVLVVAAAATCTLAFGELPRRGKSLSEPEARPVHPFEIEKSPIRETPLDRVMTAAWKKAGITPARPCSDAVFVRRVYLDLIGTLPRNDEVNRFLHDKSPQRRARLIDALMEREEFADYWAMRWGDLLRVKAEFPINLWPNGVQAYHRWIHDAIAENMPYDEFARAMLTSSGSNFRVPPVNFYRAIQGEEPEAIAGAVALTFMGSRLKSWPPEKRKDMVALFSHLTFKGTAEWKEQIICLNPEPLPPFTVRLPDGSSLQVKTGQDPRMAFAHWLIRPENPWFARALTNRAWSWFFGRGVIHEPDDIRPGNAPTIPGLLPLLEKEFAQSGWDMKHLFRTILNSRTYQQSSIPRCAPEKVGVYFAAYPVRRLEAEVLIDALCGLTGTHERYMSPIPEPFTFIPEKQRSITLGDGSITSAFLAMFGRSSRDTGYESERSNAPSDAQRLHMLNSTHIQGKIERSWKLRMLIQKQGKNPRAIMHALYIAVLSRPPTHAELKTVDDYFNIEDMKPKQAADDLVWALVNSKEFLYRH